jgi:purine/pyrimidine-nucleoside phosphorylase
MTTEKIDGASVTAQANVYFDGKCVSHTVTLADGTKKSVGVVLPSQLTFNTGAAEIMECVAGGCEYKLAGSDTWQKSGPGQKFSIPANSGFDIRVKEADGAYHYICHFG